MSIKAYHGTSNVLDIVDSGKILCSLLDNGDLSEEQRTKFFDITYAWYADLVRSFKKISENPKHKKHKKEWDIKTLEQNADFVSQFGICSMQDGIKYSELRRKLHVFCGDYNNVTNYAKSNLARKFSGVVELNIPDELIRSSLMKGQVLVKKEIDLEHLTGIKLVHHELYEDTINDALEKQGYNVHVEQL